MEELFRRIANQLQENKIALDLVLESNPLEGPEFSHATRGCLETIRNDNVKLIDDLDKLSIVLKRIR